MAESLKSNIKRKQSDIGVSVSSPSTESKKPKAATDLTISLSSRNINGDNITQALPPAVVLTHAQANMTIPDEERTLTIEDRINIHAAILLGLKAKQISAGHWFAESIATKVTDQTAEHFSKHIRHMNTVFSNYYLAIDMLFDRLRWNLNTHPEPQEHASTTDEFSEPRIEHRRDTYHVKIDNYYY